MGCSTAGEQVTAAAPDDVWGIDFQFDRVEDGQPLKVCSIVDEHTRESLGGLTGTSITGERVIALIDQIAAVRGYPLVLRSDDGPEFVCDAIADWNHQYNHVRRHSSLNYKTPIEYARDCTHRK